ncbi:MAG: hypothetical protein EXS10_06325 [Phycisphaerales bacterium]|nr:hypothetical protein [Phycisphaerales bacterium]
MMQHLVALAALFSTSIAAAQLCPGIGDCRKPHAEPGCVMPECCTIVCELNPLCCEFTWDQGCADLAIDMCDGINCPAEGVCSETHPTPGCDQFPCCDFVCAIDGWCCSVTWDEICANEANRVCGIAGCAIEIPIGAIEEAEPCYEHFNDGCNKSLFATRAVAFGQVYAGKFATDAPRDTDWMSLSGSQAGSRVRVEIAGEFPWEFQIVTGSCEGPLEVPFIAHGGPCAPSTLVDFIVPSGAWYAVITGGVETRTFRHAFTCDEIDPIAPPPKEPPEPSPYGLRYWLRMTHVLQADLDGDGLVDARDLSILLNAWGTSDSVADLNGNGTVDAADLSILLNAWSQ